MDTNSLASGEVMAMSSESKHIPVAKKLCRTNNFKTLDKVIYRYNNSGLHVPDGEAFIEREAQDSLGNRASSYVINEVVNWIKRELPDRASEYENSRTPGAHSGLPLFNPDTRIL